MKLQLKSLAFFCMIACGMSAAQAQVNPDASRATTDLLRNTDQNIDNLLKSTQPKAATQQSATPSANDKGFARLHEVVINSPLLQEELMNYWVSEINKPVPAEKLAAFKGFAWDLFQRKGYLTYITLQTKETSEGTILTVNVVKPVIGQITVSLKDGEKGREFAEEVLRRFAQSYPSGAGVDVAGFEAQLNAASYDMPVDLTVSLRQADEKTVDVVIELAITNHETGKLISGIAQVNNYGLSQFSRYQTLGSVKVAGFTPLSEATISSQVSQGVFYGRLDYEAPITGTGLHWRSYGSEVFSASGETRGLSSELGFGLIKLLSTNRYGKSLVSLDAGYRNTLSTVSGIQNSQHMEHNTRLKLHSEYSKTWVDNFYNDLSLVGGSIQLNPTSEPTDTYGISGYYRKLEISGGISQSLGENGDYLGMARWRGQVSSKNLEGYDRFALGGVTSLRGFSAVDGVGDKGFALMFDLNKQITADFYAGLLFDVGRVQDRHYYVDSSAINNNTPYTLKDAGFSFGGKALGMNWSGSVAKSLGDTTPSGWLPNQTVLGTWRAYLAGTYAF